MGWLEGILTGYAKRHYEIEDDKRRAAELAADREGKVFDTLLNSKYKDIQQYAMAGMLDLANPRRRKGGVAGWMGEVEQTPYLDMIKRAQDKFDADPAAAQANLREDYPGIGEELGGTPPGTPSIPKPSGSVPPPAPGQPPAAQPSTALTTGGTGTAPTPAPTPAPAPTPTPPPVPPAAVAGGAAGAPPVPPTTAAEAAQPQVAQAQAQAAQGAGAPPTPPTAAAAPPPAGPPAPPRRTQLPGIFPTATETAMDAARARSAGTDLGEQDSYIRVALAQGLTRADGLQMWAEAQMKARGGVGAASPYSWRTMEYTDDKGVKHRILARTNRSTGKIEDTSGNPLPANATPVTPGLYPTEALARRMALDPLLTLNQAMTLTRAMYPNATGEEVMDLAEAAFNQSRAMAAAQTPTPNPNPAPAPAPAPVTPPVTPPDPAALVTDPAPGGVAPPTAALAPFTPVPAHAVPQTAATLSEAVRKVLTDSGRADLLTQRRDVGRPATTPERDKLQAYLLSRQSLDILQKKDPVTGLSLEDRIARQPLGSQLVRRLMPDPLNFLLPADAQLYKAAAERFSEARVRRVSGAQVRPDEYAADREIFFAQPGNTPDVIAAKQRMREAEMDAAVFASGPAYEEYFHKPYVPTLQQTPTGTGQLPDPMPPPPPNRAVPRSGGMAPVPSHTPTTPPPAAAAPGAPTGTPKAVLGPDGKWYIVFQ